MTMYEMARLFLLICVIDVGVLTVAVIVLFVWILKMRRRLAGLFQAYGRMDEKVSKLGNAYIKMVEIMKKYDAALMNREQRRQQAREERKPGRMRRRSGLVLPGHLRDAPEPEVAPKDRRELRTGICPACKTAVNSDGSCSPNCPSYG